MSITAKIISYPPIWNTIQRTLGFPAFKKEFYSTHLQSGGKLLDFGCATGHLADVFSDYDEYYGVDVDEPSIQAANERFASNNDMHFVYGDICDDPFPENTFDQVVVGATLHHLSDKAIANIFPALARCTKPGGVIHIFDPVVQTKDGWQPRLMRAMDQGRHPRSLDQMHDVLEPIQEISIGQHTIKTPYGALIQDCDFIHLPLVVR